MPHNFDSAPDPWSGPSAFSAPASTLRAEPTPVGRTTRVTDAVRGAADNLQDRWYNADPGLRQGAIDVGRAALIGAAEGAKVADFDDGSAHIRPVGVARAIMNPRKAAVRAAFGGARGAAAELGYQVNDYLQSDPGGNSYPAQPSYTGSQLPVGPAAPAPVLAPAPAPGVDWNTPFQAK